MNDDSDIYFTYACASSSRVLCTNVEIVCDEFLGSPCGIVTCCEIFHQRRDRAIVVISAMLTFLEGPCIVYDTIRVYTPGKWVSVTGV